MNNQSSTHTQNIWDENLFLEVVSRLCNSRDCSALACTSKSLCQFSAACKKNFQALTLNGQPFGLFYDKYQLCEHQTVALNHFWQSWIDKQPYIYCRMPMSSGKTAIAIFYCLEAIRARGGSALIAAPSKGIFVFEAEITKLGLEEKVKIIKNNTPSGELENGFVYIIDRSRKSKQLNLVANQIKCVFVDEAHTGEDSLFNICKQVCLANQKETTVQTILMTACTKRLNTETEGKIEMSLLYETEEGRKAHSTLCFQVYEPKIIGFEQRLPDLHFYPCLLSPGSYYSVTLDKLSLLKEIINPSVKELGPPSTRNQVCKQTLPERIAQGNPGRVDGRLSLHQERFIIMCQSKAKAKKLESLLSEVEYCETSISLSQSSARVVVVDANKFSESLNISFFKNIILYKYQGSEERARQCIGRLQRTTNAQKFLRIWIISQASSLAFSIIPPKSLINDYTSALGNVDASISSVKAACFQDGLSFAEMTVLARKTICPNMTRKWLETQKHDLYTTDELLNIIRQKPCEKVIEKEGCLLVEMQPIIVNYRSSKDDAVTETVTVETKELSFQAPDTEQLSEIILNPRKRGLYSVEDLRKFCRSYGISTSGKKEQLAQRLISILIPD